MGCEPLQKKPRHNHEVYNRIVFHPCRKLQNLIGKPCYHRNKNKPREELINKKPRLRDERKHKNAYYHNYQKKTRAAPRVMRAERLYILNIKLLSVLVCMYCLVLCAVI